MHLGNYVAYLFCQKEWKEVEVIYLISLYCFKSINQDPNRKRMERTNSGDFKRA